MKCEGCSRKWASRIAPGETSKRWCEGCAPAGSTTRATHPDLPKLDYAKWRAAKQKKPGDAWIAAVSAYLDVYLMFQVCSIRIPQLQSITYPYTSVSWYPEYCDSMRIQGHLIAHWPGCCLNRTISMNSDSNNAILNYS